MKRSINRWTMSLATAGLLALPVTSFAKASQEQAPPQQQQPQQPQPAQPQPDRPQQPPTDPQPQPTPQPQPQPAQPQPTQPQPTEPQTPRPTTSAAQSPSDQSVSPQEHLRQAQDAVKAISGDAVPAKNRSDFAKLKQHLSNLEKMGSSPSASTAEPASPGAGKSASAPKANWGTEVAAIDKIISEIVGSETASPATSTPGATGTSGAAKSSAAIDDATRAKLMEVRTHITAYAAAMAGAPSTPKSEEPASTAAPTAAAAPSSTASPAAASPSTPSSQPPAATPSAESPAAGAQNPPATQPDPNAPAQPPAAGQQPAAAGAAPANADEAHRHLVAARDTLSQLTQLPAAAQLNGEARTQVSQLISNFNELIGNPPDWRASYQKVAANMTALLGPENSDAEAQGGAPTAAAGATPAPGATPTPTPSATPGAVGTAGTASVELDPSIRAKLVEFRRSLTQFEKAAGGTK
jgi:DNA polymerase III subunit gamma/tau